MRGNTIFGLVVILPFALVASGTASPRQAGKKTIRACTDYSQETKDAGVYMTVANSCKAQLSCEIKWDLICEDLNLNKTTHEGHDAFELYGNTSYRALASSAKCGQGSWKVANINWRCKVNND